jgi:carbon-monoxide dehydrogenase medium subunit
LLVHKQSLGHADKGYSPIDLASDPEEVTALKLPDVDYIRPITLCEAVDALAVHGTSAKLIAGGQSLMPMLAFRLLAPKLLIDIGRIPGLEKIELTDEGVRIGALATWHAIERHPGLGVHHPLLQAAIKHVAHYQIRIAIRPQNSRRSF